MPAQREPLPPLIPQMSKVEQAKDLAYRLSQFTSTSQSLETALRFHRQDIAAAHMKNDRTHTERALRTLINDLDPL